MSTQVILQQAGPLPLKATFSAPGNMPMHLVVNGSVWSQIANTLIGFTVTLEGQNVGKAQIFSNGTATHRAVVPAYIPIKLSEGQHTLTLTPLNAQTLSDYNDFYTVVIDY